VSSSTAPGRKLALLTGASGGIGRAIAIRLAHDGYDLVLTGRDSARLEKSARLARNASEGTSATRVVAADLNNARSPTTIVDAVRESSDHIDLLISNAGVAVSETIEETSLETWETMMRVNATAPFFLIQQAIPLLRAASSPTVIVISSVVGHVGYARQAAYSASKHALAGFTKAMARELQPEGIRVHIVSPGGVATEMVGATRPDLDPADLIQTEDIAGVVSFLASSSGTGVVDEINIRRTASTPWG